MNPKPINFSLSIVNANPSQTSVSQKIALSFVGVGLLIVLISLVANNMLYDKGLFFVAALISIGFGSIWYTYQLYKDQPKGIKNNGIFFKDISSRGVVAWLLGIILTGFYVCLYWFPQYLQGLITLFNPLSKILRGGKVADQWFVYGSFYTISVVLMGIKMMFKYKHSRYQLIRTASVMFFQLGFAFLIPAFLISMQQPELYFSYFFPLAYYQGTPQAFESYQSIAHTTNLGLWYFGFGLAMFFIGTPILTYFFGKRWYCSWVCGCGGLAETAGDPFRHLSDKSLKAWQIERYMVHGVLVMVLTMTTLLWVNVMTNRSILNDFSEIFYKFYAFWIGSTFSGVVGVGFYPILGSRVWCRFGCPMAAWLGLCQKYFSRFRITVNGGQCISCGNCSTHCEMGIDVKAYAQRGQNIVRASCVGCGICSAVCPRGVLKLENTGDDLKQRTDKLKAFYFDNKDIKVNL